MPCEATSVQTQNFASLHCLTALMQHNAQYDTAQANNSAHHVMRVPVRTDAMHCVSTMHNRTKAR